MNQYTRIALGITVAGVLVGMRWWFLAKAESSFRFRQTAIPACDCLTGSTLSRQLRRCIENSGLNFFLGRSNTAAFGEWSNDTIIPNTNITATINGSSGPLFTTPAQIVRVNNFYTVYTGGTTSANYTSILTEDSQAAAPNRSIELRAIDVGANTGPVDLYFVGGTTFSSSGLLFSNLSYGNVSTTSNSPLAVDGFGYLVEQISFRNSTYTVFVTPHGSQTILASAQVNPVTTTAYSIAVTDGPNGSGSLVTVLPDQRPQ